jgi:1-acyl-sn-glycerol-3-phosphate acyltransferase
MEKIRSIIFDIVFYVFSILYFILFFAPLMILPRSFCVAAFKAWTHCTMFFAKIIIRLTYEEKNKHFLEEAVKNGPVILACKHQSAWETIFCSLFTDKFVIVLKKVLLYIPLHGMYLVKLNSIFLDRTQGIKSLRKLLKSCKNSIDNNQSILIFPEGRRGIYGEPGEYQPGIVAIYRDLNVPVIPIGLNSGKFWPRKARLKKPGCIVVEYGKPIPPNLPKAEFKKLLEESIEELSAKD